MYDVERHKVELSDDELTLVIESLERAQDYAVGVAESITIENLLEKLDGIK